MLLDDLLCRRQCARQMGADGVLMGSRMLVAEEMWSHPAYKERVASGTGDDSCIVMSSFNRHHRVLRNEAAEKVLALEAGHNKDIEAYAELIDGMQVRKAYETGDYSTGMIDYGQATHFANEIKPVEAIFDELIDDFVTAKSRLDGLMI